MRKEDFVKDNHYVLTKDTNFLTMANRKHVLVRQNEKILFSHYQDYLDRRYSTFRETRDLTVSLVFLFNDISITPQFDCRNIALATSETNVLDASNLRMERAKALRRRIVQAETNMKSIIDLIEAKMNERDALRAWIEKAQTQASNLENFPDDATAMADMLNKIRGSNELTEEKLKEIVASFALV